MPKDPIRCFEGEGKPHEPFWAWNISNQVEGPAPEVTLDGYISEYSWYEDEITPKMFKDDLTKYGKGGPITVRISSYGGDVIAAAKMHTILRDYPGEVTVVIDGIAASAATVVAVAGDVVKIQETAYFMIHDPLAMFFLAALNIEDLTKLLDSLKAVKEGIINAYETKTSLSRNRISNLMTEQTWMDATKAAELGFVDEIIHQEKKVELPQSTAMVNALRRYVNVPEALIRQCEPVNPEPESPEVTKLRARIKFDKE